MKRLSLLGLSSFLLLLVQFSFAMAQVSSVASYSGDVTASELFNPAPNGLTGTAGTTLCLLNSNCVASGNWIFTGSGTTFGSPTAAWFGRIDGPATSQKGLFWAVGGGPTNTRLFLGLDGVPASGASPGDDLIGVAYDNNGTSLGQWLKVVRGVGPIFSITPNLPNNPARQTYIHAQVAPFATAGTYPSQDGSLDGNYEDWGVIQEPTYNLGDNPITVTGGSVTAVVTWAGCCDGTTSAPFNGGGSEWVYLSGASAIGSDPVISGWYKIALINGSSDQFDITLATASGVSGTISGGGGEVTLRPSFVTLQDSEYSIVKTGAGGGFPVQHQWIYYADPEFSDPSASTNYEQWFTRFVTPNDPTGSGNWVAAQWEDDLYNRWPGALFNPITRNTVHNMNGILVGPHRNTPDPDGGLGQGYNWGGALIDMFGSNDSIGRLGSYKGLAIEPNALVGAADDPSGHGGAGIVGFGSYSVLNSNPFTVGASTNIVSAQLGVFGKQGNIQVGDSFWLPGSFTINGLTFGNAEYEVGTFDYSTGVMTFAASGTSGSGSASGGGTNVWVSFDKQVPDSLVNAYGTFAHGAIHTERNFHSSDGLLIHTSPGNGMGWDDGSATASVTGTEGSAGNVGITLETAGTGIITTAAPVKLKIVTVSALPPCNSNSSGELMAVSDASSPTYNGSLTGGGTAQVPVYCNGSAWTAH